MFRADGTTCWTTTRGEALRGPEGAVVMLRGTVHNIDDRKRAEVQLHLQSAALNAASHSMLITDREGTIVWINPAYTALTGYSPEEAIGRNPRELVKSGEHDRAFYDDLWATILAGNVLARRADQPPKGRHALRRGSNHHAGEGCAGADHALHRHPEGSDRATRPGNAAPAVTEARGDRHARRRDRP